MTQHSMQIELDGLINILAKHLYTEPSVFIREMIQNAHDAIVKRQVLESNEEQRNFEARIQINIQAEQGTLSFSDNGSGLTLKEIHAYLSTIGASNKRLLQTQASHAKTNKQDLRQLIGRFGIGLLSGFIVADRIEVCTRSLEGDAYLWKNDGHANYSVKKTQRDEVGSTVTLFLKPEQHRFLNQDILSQQVRLYCDIIGIAIYINQDQAAINSIDAPWHLRFTDQQHRLASFHRFWTQRNQQQKALAVLPICHQFQYIDAQSQQKKEAKVMGVLVINNQQLPNEHGCCDLFIQRMFIAANMQGLLPRWASFAGGVLECDALSPNAARDQIVHDAVFAELRQTLSTLILAWLLQLASEKTKTFSNILQVHTLPIMAMCLQDKHRSLFLAIADRIPLESSDGPSHMAKYLQQAESNADGTKTVLYCNHTPSFAQYSLLTEMSQHSILYARQHSTQAFLLLYAETWPERVRLKKFQADTEYDFTEASPEDEQKFLHLKQVGRNCLAVEIKIACSLPHDMPAIVLETDGAKARQHIMNLIETPGLSTEVLEIMAKFTHDKKEDAVVLHLNMHHALIQKLAFNMQGSKSLIRHALTQIYHNAMLWHAPSLHRAKIQDMSKHANQSLGLLLEASEVILKQNTEISQLKQLSKLTTEDRKYRNKKRLM